ncbi:MAG TPA: MFS transporter [Syntrophobacteraceae bacterium]|nr:MFS transporter [Syntrophobacteraceae bacterium]
MAILSKDGSILFITRMVRLFAYGSLSVILLIYLAQIGLSDTQIGLLLTLTLLGDTVISLWLTTRADRVGRRRMLLAGAGLMVFGGTLFALTTNFAVLLTAAIIGVISPSGYEVGPFLSIEQSALSNIIPNEKRTHVFAWYNLAGLFTTAFGAVVTGILVQLLQNAHITPVASYRTIIVGYAALGFLLAALFCLLSPLVEIPGEVSRKVSSEFRKRFGLHRSKGIVFKLSALFSLDAFAGGFILQSILAYWFYKRFGVQPAVLGSIFFGANILAGVSSLSASWMASRIGLVKTMVYTHIPSNILLMLVPLMPNLPLAITVLLLRFSISQMDVPTRQSYVMAVVEPDERSAAAGITGIARTVGASLSPVLAGPLLASAALASIPFFISGSLKIMYDLLLYRSFQAIRAPEESE